MSNASDSETFEAERAIERVLTQYARGIDRCDENLLRDCYWPDATDDHGTFKGNGHDFASWVVPFLAKVFASTQHALSNTLIDVDLAAERARVESYVTARHVTRSAPPQLVEVGGRYLDRFARREGEWRIARRVVLIDWSRSHAIESSFPTADYVEGARKPDDLSYQDEF